MAVQFITGNQGSGKSAYGVKQISKILRNPNAVVFSNIDGFNFGRWKLYFHYENKNNKNLDYITITENHGQYIDISEEIRKRGQSFFDYDFQQKYLKEHIELDREIYYFIDEAQRLFPSHMKDENIIYFFDYARHDNMQIYLLTQARWKVTNKITYEYEMRAVPRSLRTGSHFTYKKMIDNEVLARPTFKADPRIFSLYKSANVHNTNYSTPPVIYALPVFFIFSVGMFIYALSRFSGVA